MLPGAAGMALLEVTSVLDPAVEHVIEETRARQARADQDPTGEDQNLRDE